MSNMREFQSIAVMVHGGCCPIADREEGFAARAEGGACAWRQERAATEREREEGVNPYFPLDLI